MPLLDGLLISLTCATAAYFTISAVQLSLGSRRASREIAAGVAVEPTQGGAGFVIILPMLREQRTVADALRYFSGIAQARDDMTIIVAVTARERLQWQTLPTSAAQNSATTGMLAEASAAAINAAAGRKLVAVVEAAADREGKVGQLNAAIDWWRAATPAGPDHTYFVLYDADSRPDRAVFDCARALVRERVASGAVMPAALQQISCYCRNLAALRGWRGLLSIADAIAQTRWALGFEYGRYRRYANAVALGRTRPLVYCIGHGCFVHAGFLESVGGFPTISATDDLALGYLISTLGGEVVPLPALDYCEVVPDPFASIRQSRFWYYGSSRFSENIDHFCSAFGRRLPRLQYWRFQADGHGLRIAWAWRAAAAILALLVALLAGWVAIVLVLVAAHLLYVQIGYFETLRQLRRIPGGCEAACLDRMSRSRLAAAGLAASVMFVVRSLGPLSVSIGLSSPARIGWKTER